LPPQEHGKPRTPDRDLVAHGRIDENRFARGSFIPPSGVQALACLFKSTVNRELRTAIWWHTVLFSLTGNFKRSHCQPPLIPEHSRHNERVDGSNNQGGSLMAGIQRR
jgi:hypothetical protein